MNTSKIIELTHRWPVPAAPAAGRTAAPSSTAVAVAELRASLGSAYEAARDRQKAQAQAQAAAPTAEAPPPMFLRRYGLIEGTFQAFIDLVVRPTEGRAFRVYGRPDPTPSLDRLMAAAAPLAVYTPPADAEPVPPRLETFA